MYANKFKKNVIGQFTKAKDAIAGLAQAEAEKARHDKELCSWEDPSDVAFYRSEKKQRERERMIRRVSPKMNCPMCKEVEPNIRQWIVSRDRSRTMCRKCFYKLQHNPPPSGKIKTMLPLAKHEPRFIVDDELLTDLIDKTGISSRHFARLAGWSASYQQKLENGSINSVSEENLGILVKVFEKLGIQFDQLLEGDESD